MGAPADFWIMLALFEVANKAAAFGNRDMLSLDNLGMAACAPQPLPAPQVLKMDSVVESNPLEPCRSFEEPFLVTTFAQAALIRDFRPWLGLEIELCPVAENLVEPFELYSPEGAHSGRIMADAAFNVGVTGLCPALVKRFHVMTNGAEPGVGSVFG